MSEHEKIQSRIEKELERLVEKFGLGKGLKIRFEDRMEIVPHCEEDTPTVVTGEYNELQHAIIIYPRNEHFATYEESVRYCYLDYVCEKFYGDHVVNFNQIVLGLVDGYQMLIERILKVHGKAFNCTWYQRKSELLKILSKII